MAHGSWPGSWFRKKERGAKGPRPRPEPRSLFPGHEDYEYLSVRYNSRTSVQGMAGAVKYSTAARLIQFVLKIAPKYTETN